MVVLIYNGILLPIASASQDGLKVWASNFRNNGIVRSDLYRPSWKLRNPIQCSLKRKLIAGQINFGQLRDMFRIIWGYRMVNGHMLHNDLEFGELIC